MKVQISRKISFNDSIADGETSPTKLFTSAATGLTPVILQKYHNYQIQYLNLAQILNKPRSQRTHTQHRFVTEFARKNTALKELADLVGPDFDRGLLRDAKLQHFQVDQVIEFKGAQINRIYVILEGKLGTIKNGDESDMMSEMKKKYVYQELTGMARKEQKKLSKLLRKHSSLDNEQQRVRQNYISEEEPQILEVFDRNDTFGDKQRCMGQQHKHTVVALEPSLVAMIDIRNFLHWLNYCFQRRLETSFSLLRKYSCFSHISDEILEEMIQFLSVVNMRKGDFVYSQGSQPTHIFFLQEGELKIQKESQLFVENPNQLYVDRRQLMTARQIHNKEYLEYANFHRLYNYQPTCKNIDLGILTPICLFGQEEILQNRPRETSIRCSSLTAKYFSIQLKKLIHLMGQGYSQFLQAVKESMKEKIRYRQAAFAVAIGLENRSKLKYFYEGDSPTKGKKLIRKINSKLEDHSITEPTADIKQKISLTERNNRSTILESINNPQEVYIPSYNSFNFHRMLRTKLKRHSHIGDSSSEDEQQACIKGESARELKLVNDSHTWRGVRAKVIQQFKLGKKIGTLAHKVNFGSPLIDEKYFRNIDSEMKRLEREKRKGKTDFKIRCKSFTSSSQSKK